MPGEKPSSEENDEHLFAEAMTGIAPLEDRGDHIAGATREPPSRDLDELEAEEVMSHLQDLVDGEARLSIHETDEAIEGAVEGIDPRIVTRLKKGDFSVQDHLDLHGLTREEARAEVENFIDNAMLAKKRCVLIIHGRGLGSKDRDPVLKNSLRNWFTRRGLRKKILAFATARPCDGGAGAIYVLLRR